jgi:tetratricopeptide (TPR) repeat protein
LVLRFAGTESPELLETEFRFDAKSKTIHRGRGRDLIWSKGALALSLCLLEYVLWPAKTPYVYQGPHRASPQGTLGKLISESAAGNWLTFAFWRSGPGPEGAVRRTVLRDVFSVESVNLAGKNPAIPVRIAIDPGFLPADCIEIHWEDVSPKAALTGAGIKRLLERLRRTEVAWYPNLVPPIGQPAGQESESDTAFAPLDCYEPVSDFVGREKECEELAQILASNDGPRIVLIHGMPGLGKTQLALKAATQLASIFTDGQVFVALQTELGARCAISDVLATCLRQVKGRTAEIPQREDELALAYHNSLSGKRILIVADNAADAEQIRRLVPPRCCALLVTAREKLDAPEAARFVAPDVLEPEKARDLLTAICPRIPEEAAQRIGELCGYLPLALRSAGTLLEVTDELAPDDYVCQLSDERKRLERIGRAGVPVGVEAAFNVSYSRLPEEACAAFRRLAVFPATFETDAAAICCQDPDARLLSGLKRRGLVMYSDRTKRYWLHDLIRLFALARLRQMGSEELATRRRHADFFLGVLQSANRLFSEETAAFRDGLVLFETERTNILSAWSWTATERSRPAEDAARCSRFGQYADILVHRGVGITERFRLFEESTRAAETIHDPRAQAASLYGQAKALFDRGGNSELRASIPLLKEASTLTRDKEETAGVYSQIGNVYMAIEPRDVTRALEFHQKAVGLIPETGDIGFRIRALGRLALTYFSGFQPDRALPLFEEGLRLAGSTHPRSKLYVLNFFGQMQTKLGRRKSALAVLAEARELALLFDDQGAESAAILQLGRLAMQNDPKQALAYFQRSLQINQESGQLRKIAGAYRDIGKAHMRLGQTTDAGEALTKGATLSDELGWHSCAKECRGLIESAQREGARPDGSEAKKA